MYQLRNMGEATWYSFIQAPNTFMGFMPSRSSACRIATPGRNEKAIGAPTSGGLGASTQAA
jgi:hypothetical protein